MKTKIILCIGLLLLISSCTIAPGKLFKVHTNVLGNVSCKDLCSNSYDFEATNSVDGQIEGQWCVCYNRCLDCKNKCEKNCCD